MLPGLRLVIRGLDLQKEVGGRFPPLTGLRAIELGRLVDPSLAPS